MFYKIELENIAQGEKRQPIIVAAHQHRGSIPQMEQCLKEVLSNPTSLNEHSLAKEYDGEIHSIQRVSVSELFDHKNGMEYADYPFIDLDNLTISGVRMSGTIQFNRPIEESDYLCPGGFCFVMNGAYVEFDFTNSAGSFNKNIYEFEMEELDTFSFPHLKFLTPEMLQNITKIDEFFVYSDDESLIPVKIKSLSISYETPRYEKIDISDSILEKAELTFNGEEQEKE